jgi:hypothetical protein
MQALLLYYNPTIANDMRRIAAKVFLPELLLQLIQPFHPKLLPALCCSKKSLNVQTGATQV